MSLCRVSFLAHQGRSEAAAVAFKQAQESWPAFVSAEQLERARALLCGMKRESDRAAACDSPIEKKLLGAIRARRDALSPPRSAADRYCFVVVRSAQISDSRTIVSAAFSITCTGTHSNVE